MYKFGKKSIDRIHTLHPNLQSILDDAIVLMDISVLCGHRGESEQNTAYNEGRSKLRFPKSKHNRLPSRAVDIAPHPIDWNDIEGFKQMGWMIKGVAQAKGIKIKWGGDWHNFKDYPHFELED
jgi:peptidoglycan L-alanyl-D-glutamate endopeptidase CwlK